VSYGANPRQRRQAPIGLSILTPTPTAPERTFRRADFATVAEALDHAALQSTGINIHSLRGELIEVLPYAALREQASALAGRLLGTGLAPGDRVALAAESDGDFLRAFFACQYAGLVPAPVPLPAPFGGKDAYVAHLRRMIIAAGASAAFAPPALAAWFAEAGEGLSLRSIGPISELPDVASSDTAPAADPEGLCYLQFSSGSTRFPLGVAVTQAALMANIAAIGRGGLDVGSADRTVSWLPLYHDMGLVGMLLSSLAFQSSVDLIPTGAFVRRPFVWLDLISRRRATISYAPTFGYELAARRVGAAGLDGLDLSSWRVAGLGGDMIRPEPLRAFVHTFAPRGFDSRAFVASYGMAEATLALSLSPLNRGLMTDTVEVSVLERAGHARAPRGGARTRELALCGRVLKGHRLEIRDDRGAVLPDRRVGRIFASGPSLMRAYFGEPEETAKVLSPDGWLDTGDLGYSLDGEVVITGRVKDLIIVNGRNLWPQDLEWTAEKEIAALRAGDVAAFSIPGEDGERVVALAQCRTGDPALREALRTETANLIRVRHGIEALVVLVPPHSLPQTSSGKLSRSGARNLYLSGAFDLAPARATA